MHCVIFTCGCTLNMILLILYLILSIIVCMLISYSLTIIVVASFSFFLSTTLSCWYLPIILQGAKLSRYDISLAFYLFVRTSVRLRRISAHEYVTLSSVNYYLLVYSKSVSSYFIWTLSITESKKNAILTSHR